MRALRKLVVVESKLLSRDWGLVAFGLVFPPLLLWLLAFIPGFGDPEPDLGGLRLIDVYTAVAIVLAFAMVGVTSIPAFLAAYRHQGVLRRLRTTPVGPMRLLGAQLLAHLLLALLATGLTIAVALLALGVPVADHWPAVALSVLLAATSMFSIGLLIGAVAPSPTSAPTIGTFVFLGLMFLAGLMYPREAMSEGLRRVTDFSPSGAAVDAISGAWLGTGAPMESLLVLVASTLGVGLLAAWLFRWE